MVALGAMALGASWSWALGADAVVALLGAVGRRLRAKHAETTDSMMQTPAALSQSVPSRKARRRAAACMLAAAAGAVDAAGQSDEEPADAANAVDTNNPFALLDAEAAQRVAVPAPAARAVPARGATAVLRTTTARGTPAAPVAPKAMMPAISTRLFTSPPVDGRPRRCEISRSVADHAGDVSVLEAVRPVPIFRNPVLDAILEGQLVTRAGSALQPGESCVRGTTMRVLPRMPYNCLQMLELDACQMSTNFATRLAVATNVRLTTLTIRSTDAWVPEGITPLRDAGHLAGLKSLSIEQFSLCKPNPSALGDALRAMTYLMSLESLTLRRCLLDDSTTSTILNAPHLQNLRHLNLSINHLTDESACAIAQASPLLRLKGLDLNDNRITDVGMRALAAAPHVQVMAPAQLKLAGNRNDVSYADILSHGMHNQAL